MAFPQAYRSRNVAGETIAFKLCGGSRQLTKREPFPPINAVFINKVKHKQDQCAQG